MGGLAILFVSFKWVITPLWLYSAEWCCSYGYGRTGIDYGEAVLGTITFVTLTPFVFLIVFGAIPDWYRSEVNNCQAKVPRKRKINKKK